MSLDNLVCPLHGWLGHSGIHEAGHATAGILLNFEFVELVINPGHEVYEQLVLGNPSVAAYIQMATNQPAEWIGPRPEDALVYLLAGFLAEKKITGHHLPAGYQGDINMWRRGTGRTEAPTSVQVEEMNLVLLPSLERAQKLVDENIAAICRVYGLVTALVPNDGKQHQGFEEPLVISYDEIRAAVLATS